MYIKSIVLDGFKSYGNRVEVTGFDPQFNAITGLNGTGKSNILDSICFVLGITNLSNVRAGSLQELIYKHGQAGITKATVSITFDNRDKKQCPIGYENHDEITVTRQVVMGGKNRYLINGINVQNKRVSDLFCSVQLNVNNPHFLIMQGRITKVLNMKPPEILSMVEEAAGTRMYEAKKLAAQKTIEKKDAKLRELNDIIREDIAPKLQKLQDERAQFQEYQKVVRELDNLTKLHTAWEYVKAEEKAKESEKKVTDIEDEIKEKKQEIKNNEKESKEIDKKIVELNKKLDEESGSVLRELESSLEDLEKTEARVGAARRTAADSGTALQRRGKLLARARDDDCTALASKRAALTAAAEACSGLRADSEASEAALTAAQQRFLTVSSGQETGSETLQDQLICAKKEASEASTRVSQSKMERKHCEERLEALRREFSSGSAQHDSDQRALAASRRELAELEAELASLDDSRAEADALGEEARQLRGAARSAKDELDALSARLTRCNFTYATPEPGFDHSSVYGPLCRLIEVKDPVYCTAVETAAGGKLYNVVVDTERTSKLVLTRGQLQARTTIVPLDRIAGAVIDERTLAAARAAGGGAERVQLALELVASAARVAPAVRWALGGTLVCRDLDTARRVTFHPAVRRRSVTLDGDVCDPAGTLAGGARLRQASVLQQLAELRALERRAAELSERLAAVLRRLEAAGARAAQHAARAQRREELAQALRVLGARAAAAPHAALHADMQAAADRVAELSAAIERDEAAQKEAAARAKELEAKVKDIKGHREREFKKAEQELAKAKKEAEKHGSQWRARSQELETLQLEVKELETAVANSEQQLAETTAAAEQQVQAAEEARREHEAALEAVREMQARIKRQKSDIASRNSDVAKLAQQKERLHKKSGELELAIKQLEFNITDHRKEAAACNDMMASLEKKHPWVPEQRQYFGARGGLFDFAGARAEAAGARLGALAAARERLARGLNARAHALLGQEEDQYHELVRKKAIVEADRAKLVQVIRELDDKKRRTLAAACEQVSRDFGRMFSTLLPGAQAALRGCGAGGCVLAGLEVRVAFNHVWKESLGELSGGQRSLVALALVLAMLLFKPAPLYILDEVDAALDLSHTQNIGIMLKEHFKHSQFIIVSLKDGMFNNANVLFRTRFVDGMSSVQRTVNTRR